MKGNTNAYFADGTTKPNRTVLYQHGESHTIYIPGSSEPVVCAGNRWIAYFGMVNGTTGGGDVITDPNKVMKTLDGSARIVCSAPGASFSMFGYAPLKWYGTSKVKRPLTFSRGNHKRIIVELSYTQGTIGTTIPVQVQLARYSTNGPRPAKVTVAAKPIVSGDRFVALDFPVDDVDDPYKGYELIFRFGAPTTIGVSGIYLE